MEGLKLENVTPTLSVYQKKGVFSYGTDAVLLANYALSFYKSLKSRKCLDLCCGTGIIPLLMCDKNRDLTAVAVDINKEACDIAWMSAEYSNLSGRVSVVCSDLKDYKNLFAPESFDFITCNPPYMTADCGKMCTDDYKTIARHEILCNIDDIFKAAFYLLPTGGSIYIVYRPDRLSSLFNAALNNRFQIKDLVVIETTPPPCNCKLILCKAIKDGSEGMNLRVSDIDCIVSERRET